MSSCETINASELGKRIVTLTHAMAKRMRIIFDRLNDVGEGSVAIDMGLQASSP